MKATEQTEEKADALIFLKNGRTIVVNSPVRIEILRMVMTGEQRFDDIVRRIGRAKSTVSVHLRDMTDDGILAERTDENDARRKFLYLDARYLGTIAAPVCQMPAGWEEQPVLGDSVRPASVFRLIFNTIRTNLLEPDVNPCEPEISLQCRDQGGKRGHKDSLRTTRTRLVPDIYLESALVFRSNRARKHHDRIEGDQNVIENHGKKTTCQDRPKIGRPASSFDCGHLTAFFTR